MSDALYERYKEALRRGHVAAQKGREADALDAYSEAASLAPDRALPLVAIGGVLRRLGKTDRGPGDLSRRAGPGTDRRGRAARPRRGRGRRPATGSGRPRRCDRLALVLDGSDRLAGRDGCRPAEPSRPPSRAAATGHPAAVRGSAGRGRRRARGGRGPRPCRGRARRPRLVRGRGAARHRPRPSTRSRRWRA